MSIALAFRRVTALPGPGARLRLLALCCFGSLLAIASPSLAANRTEALGQTAEWKRLAALWQTLLDHSSGAVFSRARFRELVKDMDRVSADTAALSKRDLLPAEVATDLAKLFHDRYQYLDTRYYTTESNVTLAAAEAAGATADWIIELHLAAVRQITGDSREQQAAISRRRASPMSWVSFRLSRGSRPMCRGGERSCWTSRPRARRWT